MKIIRNFFMKKGIIIAIFLLIVNNIYSQNQQEIFDRFNSELNEVYGKNHEKTLEILDDIVNYYNSLPHEHNIDSSNFFAQINYIYCNVYILLNEYDKAAAYPEYKFIMLNKSIENRDYKQNITIANEILEAHDSLEYDRRYPINDIYIVLSMSHSMLDNKQEALEYLEKFIKSGEEYEQHILLPEFDNIRTTEEFAKLTLKSDWGLESDILVRASSATASNSQIGGEVNYSIDGDMSTIYHSSWKNTVFPVELKYMFNKPEVIDYMVYYPRTDGSNGNFKETEIYVSENGKERLIGKYDFKGSGSLSVIDLKGKKPEYVKVIVKSGLGDNETGFASCAEMQFFRKNDKNTTPDIFSDKTCSALKNGVTESDINAITNPKFKTLTQALYNNSYNKHYRVKEYKPYPNPSVAASKNKTGTYSLLDNATGIVAMRNEEIVVFVGKTNGQNIALRSINFDNDYSPVDHVLKEGANSIICEDGGLLYIMYHTSDKNAEPIKIHIASGKINGMYHIDANTNLDWKYILDNAKHKYIDVQGKYAHLIFPVSDFKKYTPDISRLVEVYDSIVYLESRFIGLEKYKRSNGNSMLFYVSNMDYWMFAAANRTGYSTDAMSRICDVNKLRTTEIWGPAHEVGHINQTQGLNWVGLTEVSNNIYTMYVQSMFGNKSRLSEEKLNPDFDGVWHNRYEKGFAEILAGKVLHSDHSDVFCKLIPFWQLQLYFSNVKGMTDFYADVHEQIRNLDTVPDDARQQLNFMRICCDVSKTDLSEFFERWGMLAVTASTATDHSSIPNVVNYQKDFNITERDVAEFKKYASKYPKPNANIWYIHDDCVDAFVNETSITKGNMVINGENYDTNTKNAVVYKIYDEDKLVFITPQSEFKIPHNCKTPIIYAVPAVGKPIKL